MLTIVTGFGARQKLRIGMNNALMLFGKLSHPAAVDDDMIIVFDLVVVKVTGDGDAAVSTFESTSRQK